MLEQAWGSENAMTWQSTHVLTANKTATWFLIKSRAKITIRSHDCAISNTPVKIRSGIARSPRVNDYKKSQSNKIMGIGMPISQSRIDFIKPPSYLF